MPSLFHFSLQNTLAAAYEERKARNPRYSLRAFAVSLKVGSAALSEILSGKRNVSRDYAHQLLERARIGSDVIHRVLKMADVRDEQALANAAERRSIAMDSYHLISRWYHFAILNLAETVDFGGSLDEIAHRLGINPVVAARAVRRLHRLGMLVRAADGRIRATGSSFETSDGIPHAAIRESHLESLRMAADALKTESAENRDFVAATMALDPILLPQLKKLIREFLNQATVVADASSKRQVYRLALQLYPLSDRGRPS